MLELYTTHPGPMCNSEHAYRCFTQVSAEPSQTPA
jgi:hypothetical protein